MTNLEERVKALTICILTDDPKERASAKANLLQLMNDPVSEKPIDAETIVREILLELGAPEHLKGHVYVIDAILLALENRAYLDSLTLALYPTIADKHNTIASRVERGIRHMIDTTWMRGDVDVLHKYFGNTINANKGKPTNGEFIARITNVIKHRMRGAA